MPAKCLVLAFAARACVCVGVQNWLLLVYIFLLPSVIIVQVATSPEFIFVCV